MKTCYVQRSQAPLLLSRPRRNLRPSKSSIKPLCRSATTRSDGGVGVGRESGTCAYSRSEHGADVVGAAAVASL